MSREENLEMAEEGAACMGGPTVEAKREKYKRRCSKGFSIVKVCVVAHIGLLTALIYLVAETKVGVELTDRLLYSATSYAFNESRPEARAGATAADSLLVLAQLLRNLSLSS